MEFAASWGATPQQAVQYAAVAMIAQPQNVLRIGAASVDHLIQEEVLLNGVTEKNPQMTLVESNLRLIRDVSQYAERTSARVKVVWMDALEMNEEESLEAVPDGTYDFGTSHYLLGSMPTRDDFLKKRNVSRRGVILETETAAQHVPQAHRKWSFGDGSRDI